jgi:6,7-dimethyl-8-ribityllumazine synthase
MKPESIIGVLNAQGLKVGIVVSRFNSLFTNQLLQGALDALERHGVKETDVQVVWVPGAMEIPQALQKLSIEHKFDFLIGLGVVIQGDTPHAELINTQVARSILQIATTADIPVVNGVVSTENIEQAIERSGTKAGNRGADAAVTGIEMASLFSRLNK